MNAIAGSIAASRPQSRITEQQIFVFTAALFVALTLAGFVPSSIAKVQAVEAGARPPFPVVLHVHAALMGAWLLLLLTQSVLVARGRPAVHRVLGMFGAAMVPAIVVTGVLLTITTWEGLWSPAAAAAMPPAVLEETRTFVSNILLLQARALIAFPVFITWALLLRRRDADSHRRLMLLGTAVPVLAGIDRLTMELGWTTMPASPLALDFYLLASVLPLLAWDLLRRRQVHRTTQLWLLVNLPLAIATNLLWNSQWWLATAPRLLGVA